MKLTKIGHPMPIRDRVRAISEGLSDDECLTSRELAEMMGVTQRSGSEAIRESGARVYILIKNFPTPVLVNPKMAAKHAKGLAK